MLTYTLFKVCYFGTQYHGSQRQPDLPTIEGYLLKSLFNKGYLSESHLQQQVIHSAGRTDAGVHARSMVYGFYNQRQEFYPMELNSELPEDIRIWSSSTIESKEDIPTIHPRYQAVQRHYKYVYVDTTHRLDESVINRCIASLTGTHNFQNYSKLEKTTNTIRTVDEISAYTIDSVWIFNFKARSFLWQQIRKMMRVILEIGMHNWSEDVIRDLFDPNHVEFAFKIEPVPPKGLILWDVKYPNEIKFQDCEKSLQKIKTQLDSWIEELIGKNFLLKIIRESFH